MATQDSTAYGDGFVPPYWFAVPADPRERIDTANLARLFASDFSIFAAFYFVFTLVPLYILELGGTEATVGLLTAIASISVLFTAPLYGRAADRWGRRLVLFTGLGVAGLSMLSVALVHSLGLLAAALVGNQTGFNGYQTASRTFAFDLVPSSRRGQAIATLLLAPNLAIAAAPPLGLLLWHQVDRRAPFVAAACLCALSAWVVSFVRGGRRATPATARARSRRDWIVPEALLPAAIQFLLSTSYLSTLAFLAVVGERRGIAGYPIFFSVYAVAVIAVRLLSGRISDALGRGTVLIPALISQIVSVLLVGSAESASTLALAAVALGTGWGAAYPTLTTLVADRVQPERRGAAMGLFSSAAAIGTTLGIAMVGWISGAAGFMAAFSFTAAMVGVALIVWIARGRH